MLKQFILVNFSIILLSLVCGINTNPISSPPCSMETLMIDGDVFPEGWYGSGTPRERSAPVSWGVEKLGVSFGSQKDGTAIQDVYRGKTIAETRTEYFKLLSFWFDNREDATKWYTPLEFNYESDIAHQFSFGCRTYEPSGVESCQAVGQYGVYLTRFHTFMSPIMTYSDLEHILQTIDNKMAQCLEN